MRFLRTGVALCALAGLWAGCGGGNGDGGDNTEALAYLGLEVGRVWEYDVEVGAAVLDGRVEVVKIDLEFADGIEAYQVELRQNQLLVATRWYQVTGDGLLLLGEEVQEGTGVVERTFLEPVLMVPVPIENEQGIARQSWSSTSELEQGGSETHRFDNNGKADQEVPAGTFSAFHLIHTRTDSEGVQHQYDEHFAPENWYVQFEYPADEVWKLRPAAGG
jgi:hypothetical protein